MLGYQLLGHLQKSALRSQVHGFETEPWLLCLRRRILQNRCHESRHSAKELYSEGYVPTGKGHLYRLLKECMARKDVVSGRRVHALIMEKGLESDNLLANHLIRMYASHGSLSRAKAVFGKLTAPDEYCWAAIISAHSDLRDAAEAISLYRQLRRSNIKPNDYIFVAVLKACTKISDLASGKIVHDDATQSGVASSIFVGNTLVDMYAKCGDVEEARQMFDGLKLRDLVSWNAMIAGYAQQGLGTQALELFEKMQNEGPFPDAITFVSVLKACSSMQYLDGGREIHKQILQAGLQDDLFVGNTLVDMYSKSGDLDAARRVFGSLKNRDHVSWTAIIAGYTQHGLGEEALQMFKSMKEHGCVPSSITLLSVLKACGSVAAIDEGRAIHRQIRCAKLEDDAYLGSALVDMYAKCGQMEDARRTFEGLKHRDLVSWNSIIAGYAQNGLGDQSLQLFHQMQQQGFVPDVATFGSLLKACGTIAALDEGKEIHKQILQRSLQGDVVLQSALVDMYVKCGSITEAQIIFDGLGQRNIVSWTSMIAGYAQLGLAEEAFALYQQMEAEGVTPNSITFVSLLTACNHAGLLVEGQELLLSMTQRYGITPTVEHYACIIDLLGRAGYLGDAHDLIRSMPVAPDATVWMSMLGACQCHGNIEFGRQAFKAVVEMDPKNSAAYVLLSNIYAAHGRWEDQEEVRRRMISQGITKSPGQTWIEVESQVHTFVVGCQV